MSTKRLADFSALVGIEELEKGEASLRTDSLYLPEMLSEHPGSY